MVMATDKYQPTLKAMYALSSITGNSDYAAFADRYAGYVMKNLVDEQGFFWWGWHCHYDVFKDSKKGHNLLKAYEEPRLRRERATCSPVAPQLRPVDPMHSSVLSASEEPESSSELGLVEARDLLTTAERSAAWITKMPPETVETENTWYKSYWTTGSKG